MRGLNVERSSDRANLLTALSAIEVRREALALAEESARITRLRYSEGRDTLTDLLAVEAQLRRSRTQYAVALLRAMRYHLALQRSSGLPIRIP